MTWITGKEDLFDGVAVALDLAVDSWLERRLLRHGPQAVGDEHLRPEFFTARVPVALRGRRRPGKRQDFLRIIRIVAAVVICWLAQASIPGRILSQAPRGSQEHQQQR